MREALPPRPSPACFFAMTVAVITAVPPSFARSFFVARASGSGLTDGTGVSASSSSDSDEDDDELSDLSDSELESELDEDDAAFRVDFFAVGGSLSSSESESDDSELELVSGLALRFNFLVT